jgi:nucleotide-binding universal stress UspA family protein
MVAFQRILCPVDLSPCSRGALAYALAIARWYEGRVTALHVAPPPAAGPGAGEALFEPYADARATVLRFVGSLAAAAPVEVEVRQGAAAPVILEVARERSTDLITIGSHGLAARDGAPVGSVADGVLRGSACPVLAVGAPVTPPAPVRAVPFARVLVALDFSPPSVRALEYAYALAQEANARLVLLHVVEEASSERASDDAERQARWRLHEMLPADVRLWCDPDIVVTRGTVDETVGRIAAEWRSELVVVGAFGRAASGAHVERILDRARCPVLVAPVGPVAPVVRAAEARDLAHT